MKTMSTLEVRKKFGSVLDLVASKGTPVTICRAGKPLAVLVPAAEYAATRHGRESRLRFAAERLQQWKQEHKREFAGANAVKLVRESRDQR